MAGPATGHDALDAASFETAPSVSPHLGEVKRLLPRLRAALLAVWAAVTGAAPHVLHHVGPLAGTALVAGAGGRVLFGLAGFAATVPMLRRLRRRTGSWRAPGLALAGFVAVYSLSSLFVGPALETATAPEIVEPATQPADGDHHGHDTAES